MLPVPAHLFAARKLDGDAREMKQATMRFVHALLVSTADASTFPVPADAVRRASLQREIEKSPVAA
jgi:hypothetical protein